MPHPVKNQPYNRERDIALYLKLSTSIFGEGNDNSFQYSCLENPMDRGAWQATVLGVARVGHHLVTKPPPLPEVLMYP